MSELQDSIEEALSLINDLEGGPPRRDKTSRLNALIQWFADSLFNEDYDDYLVSEENIEKQTDEILHRAHNQSQGPQNVIQELADRFESIKQSPPKVYTVVFPLNLVATLGSLFKEEFDVAGHSIRKIDQEAWNDEYYQPISDDTQFKEFAEKLPSKYNPAENTHWRLPVQARDEQYAARLAKQIIEYWLGTINYCVHGTRNHSEIRALSQQKAAYARLRHPRFILVSKCGGSQHFYRGSDLSDRDPYKMTRERSERAKKLYDNLIDYSIESETIGEVLMSTLRVYQRGLTTENTEESFLFYWRGLEMITITGRDSSTIEAVDRAESMGVFTGTDISPSRLRIIADKRNTLVHEGVNVRISTSELDIIKRLLDGAILSTLLLRHHYDKSQIESLMKYGSDSEAESFYNLLDGKRNQLKKIAVELPLFKLSRRITQIKKNNTWMRPADEWILEYLSQESQSRFDEIPLHLTLSTKYLNARKEHLTSSKFIESSDDGLWSTTVTGEKYLDGKIDPDLYNPD